VAQLREGTILQCGPRDYLLPNAQAQRVLIVDDLQDDLFDIWPSIASVRHGEPLIAAPALRRWQQAPGQLCWYWNEAALSQPETTRDGCSALEQLAHQVRSGGRRREPGRVLG
jgi:hypothetical protein